MQTTTFTVTATAGTCSSSTTVTVTVNPKPNVTVPAPAAFCSGGSVILTASGASTYTWSPVDDLSSTTGATVTAYPVSTKTYTVTGTDVNGCTASANVTVTVTPGPQGDLSSDPAVCYGNNSGTLTLTNYTGSISGWETSTDGGATWAPVNNTTTSLSYSNLTQTTIWRVKLQLNGCTNYSTIGIVPVNPPFNPTATATPSTICLGQSAILTASSYGPPPFPMEVFQNANPAGWSGNDANNNNKDDNSPWGESGNGKIFNGLIFNSQAPPTNSKFMIANGTGDGSTDYLGTPPFSLVGLTNPTFNFYTAGNFNAGTIATVQISIDGGVTFTTLLSYLPPPSLGNPNNGWTQVSINLSAYIGQSDVMVRFAYTGTAGSNWAVDNVGITGSYQPVTYQWSPTTYLTPVSGAGQTVTTTPTITGTFPYCVVATTAAGCANITPACVNVTVNPVATVNAGSPQTICAGGTINLSGTIGGSATSAIWSAPSGTFSDINSLTSTYTPGIAGGTVTLTLTTNDPAGPCSAAISTVGVTVIPVPTATITGNATVCDGTASAITFTGAAGTAPYTFTYTLNGGAATTIITTSGNSVTIPVSTTVGTYVYSLISVASANGCSQPQTGTATVTVKPLPTASIAGNATVCAGGTGSIITFTGAGGTAPYTFTYKLNGGAATNIVTISGNSVTLPVSTIAGTYVYTLVSVADVNGCSQPQTGTATVTVKALPTATLTGNETICDGTASVVIFNGAGGTAPYTFTYTLNGGAATTITTTSGNSVTLPVSTAAGTYVYTLINVADANGCSQVQTATVTALVNPIPGCNISGPGTIYSNSNNNYTVAVNPIGGIVNYSWSISGSATIVGATNGPSVNVSAGSAGTYTLTSNISRNGCTSSCSIPVTITDLPCLISGPDNICPGSADSYSGTPGMDSYSWSIVGNATISGSATGQTVSVIAENTCGSYTLSLTITKSNGSLTCSQNFSATDVTAPTWTTAIGALNVTLQCKDATGLIAAQAMAPAAIDNCGSVTYTKISGPFCTRLLSADRNLYKYLDSKGCMQ